MVYQLVVMNLDSFTNLIEEVHVCQGSESRLRKISMLGEVNNLAFECCGLELSVDKLQLTFSDQEMIQSNSTKSESSTLMQYEEVLFIDTSRESSNNFEFIPVEETYQVFGEDHNSQDRLLNQCLEIDPLMVEQSTFSESVSSLEKKLASNVGQFKVSAKNVLPKVADWSSGSFENISDKEQKKVKYPSCLICEFCGILYKGKDRIYKFFHHRNQVHTQEIKYTCPICQKIYWGERELSAHIISHLGKEHICEVCGITFQKKSDLLRHLLIHQEKKYECKFCSKMFRRRDHLTIHMRIHTKDNPYLCLTCSAGFPQKCQLNLHSKKCKPTQEKKILQFGFSVT